MANKWYNSVIGDAIGICIVCLGIGSCSYLVDSGSSKSIQSRTPQVQAQQTDLNGNNQPDKFYTIDNEVAVSEVDGEPILDFLKRQK